MEEDNVKHYSPFYKVKIPIEKNQNKKTVNSKSAIDKKALNRQQKNKQDSASKVKNQQDIAEHQNERKFKWICISHVITALTVAVVIIGFNIKVEYLHLCTINI